MKTISEETEFLRLQAKSNKKELKLLRDLYRAVVYDLERRSFGHNDAQEKVEKAIKKYKDNFYLHEV